MVQMYYRSELIKWWVKFYDTNFLHNTMIPSELLTMVGKGGTIIFTSVTSSLDLSFHS